MEFKPYKLDCWPWNDDDARKDIGCMKDSNRVWLSDDRGLLFHITSEEKAKLIITNGPQANVCRIGFDGREQQNAFWANCVPFVNRSVEIFMPGIDGGKISVLCIEVDREILPDRYHFEPTWKFVQYALKPEDVLKISLLKPENFLKLRSAEDAATLQEYWRKNAGTCTYFDTVFKTEKQHEAGLAR